MRYRALFTVLLAAAVVAAAGAIAPARADVGASGTRLSVGGGAPRFYMTYGHIEDVELYAPIIPELNRLGVSFQRRGNEYSIFHRGQVVATWPIVRSREEVPDTGEHPLLLVMGGNVFVPVRKLAEIVPIEVKWDKQANLASIVPGAERNRPAAAGAPRPAGPQPTGQIILTGIELEPGAGGVQVRVRSSARVTPNWLTLKSPPRLVLDFPNSQWADGVAAPAGMGDVRSLRTGQFTLTTARLVLELTTPAAKIVDFRVQDGEVMAAVGQGRQVARSLPPPASPGAPITAIIRRGNPVGSLGSRGQLLPQRPRVPGTLAGKVICIDAGHGGHSSGAKGLYNLEKDLCLKMSHQLRRALEERGAQVIMTREGDEFVSLEGRCQIANTRGADLFISIHLNSTPKRNSASGTETYWHTPQSWRLAQALHSRVIGTVGKDDRGIRNRGFYVIKNTTMPSVLLEIAFINNENDERLLADGGFHTNLAESLADGVLDYFFAQ
jgi:N-acetylmuramoyl-L-alanine amidase